MIRSWNSTIFSVFQLCIELVYLFTISLFSTYLPIITNCPLQMLINEIVRVSLSGHVRLHMYDNQTVNIR